MSIKLYSFNSSKRHAASMLKIELQAYKVASQTRPLPAYFDNPVN